MKKQLLNVVGLIALLAASSTYSAQAATLFSDNFDSYANGALATTVTGVTVANFNGTDSATISNAQALSGANSIRYTSDAAGAPDLNFNFASAVTFATTNMDISFSFQKVGDSYNPDMWVMFGGPNTGFANGNIALQSNGLNNFFDNANPGGGGFQFLGQGANWQTVNVAYTFTNNGTNITGYTADFTTSGGANSPTFSVTKTGLNIASIDSLRFQFRGAAAGDVYLDNVSITAIPEPSTYALLALGLGALFFLRRRRAA